MSESEHRQVVTQMIAKAGRGWCDGTPETMEAYTARHVLVAASDSNLAVSLMLSRDSPSLCWHLSIGVKDRAAFMYPRSWRYYAFHEVPAAETLYWVKAFFPDHYDLVEYEAGDNPAFMHAYLYLTEKTHQPARRSNGRERATSTQLPRKKRARRGKRPAIQRPPKPRPPAKPKPEPKRPTPSGPAPGSLPLNGAYDYAALLERRWFWNASLRNEQRRARAAKRKLDDE